MKGKRWVIVDSGPAGWNWGPEGWLVEEKPDAIRLVDRYSEVHRLRKPRPGEQQPKLKGTSIPLKVLSSEKYSAAWNIRSGDYIAVCKEVLKHDLPKEHRDREDAFGFVNERSELASVAIDAARYAHWAAQLGEKRLALDLYSLASRAHKKYSTTYIGEEGTSLHQFVADTIASGLASSAIDEAHHGAPRRDMLKTWERIAKIPYHQRRDEARRMVDGYKALIAEDDAWKEPAADALEKMPAEKKIDYWMHHLRDADITQGFSPGMCEVLSGWGSYPADLDSKKPNPAVKLKELGMAAIPKIIAHLD